MKARVKSALKNRPVALALTWDGARWPVRSLPSKAQAFLKGKAPGVAIPSRQELSKLFAGNRITEIRVCWVPRLKGGGNVLSDPFLPPAGKRIAFHAAKTVRFGDVLGVVYRRRS